MIFKKNLKSIKLTNRELEIMNILWESDRPLVASEIARAGDNLTINTVQALLKKLSAGKFIEVADIVYSGTVLSRSYKPSLSSDDYEINRMLDAYERIGQKSKIITQFVATLLDYEKDDDNTLREIDSLEEMLMNKRKELEQKR